MDLQISVFLLFILFTAGHSLKCYDCKGEKGSCADQKVETCYRASFQCMSSTTDTQNVERILMKSKGCIAAADCLSGFMDFGMGKISSVCCNTDYCNIQDAPDPSKVPNGKKCYYCDEKSCLNILDCSGNEHHCITQNVTYGGKPWVSKGCVSKSICDAAASVPNVNSVSCCEGNLCNGAQSVSQSFLFFCCSLLSYFLLH